MNNGYLKNSITFIFLALFLSAKMVGLHALTHADDKDHAIHCTICDHAIAHELTPVIASDFQEVKIVNPHFFVENDIINHYDFYNCGTITTDQLFSRPPPFLL